MGVLIIPIKLNLRAYIEQVDCHILKPHPPLRINMHKYIQTAAAVFTAIVITTPTLAQDTNAHKAALVAGYKAAFTCSGTFNAGKTIESISNLELNLIYPNYRETLKGLPAAIINEQEKWVSVKYSITMPPRISAWRENLGCSQLPMGASVDDIAMLPKLKLASKNRTLKDKNWPIGDQLTKNKTPARLQAVLDKAFDHQTYGEGTETSAVLVTSASNMIGEAYRDGYSPFVSQRTWSVAKSIAVSIIGVAVKEDLLDVKAPAPIPEWQSKGDPRAKITLENLLHMSSGLYSGKLGSRTDQLYAGGARVTDRSTEAPLDAMPGKRWRYANNDTLLSVRALRASIGDDRKYLAYPFEKLIHKIGMNTTFLETDWEGNFILSSQVWTTARDLGRLGVLYLQDGSWQGEQILPKGWATYVSTPAPNQPPLQNSAGNPSWGYGAQFWLLGERFDLPKDGYLAAGHRGQYIFVIPSKDLVIVRRGYDESGADGFNITAFTRDVLKALSN